MNITIKEIILTPINNKRLISLCGPLDENLKQLELQLNVLINRHNNLFIVKGMLSSVNITIGALIFLYSDTEIQYGIINHINLDQVHLVVRHLQEIENQSKFPKHIRNTAKLMQTQTKIVLKNRIIKPRTLHQAQYIDNILRHNVTFGVGPSGTGKTYLAIAVAIDLIERQKNQHLILSRPAIEAGEKLGFLPGDFNQKTDPYIRPLYDALYDVLGYERMDRLIKKNVITVLPLAYMRGRTLNNSIIILDESQNSTITQMKMFLTRIGYNSIAIITGDITQVDLPANQKSGLAHAIKILSKIKDISFNFFNKEDSVRHTIVAQIINAYETSDHI